jgi:hypothetical protein
MATRWSQGPGASIRRTRRQLAHRRASASWARSRATSGSPVYSVSMPISDRYSFWQNASNSSGAGTACSFSGASLHTERTSRLPGTPTGGPCSRSSRFPVGRPARLGRQSRRGRVPGGRLVRSLTAPVGGRKEGPDAAAEKPAWPSGRACRARRDRHRARGGVWDWTIGGHHWRGRAGPHGHHSTLDPGGCAAVERAARPHPGGALSG